MKKHLKSGMVLLMMLFSILSFSNLAQASSIESKDLKTIKDPKILVDKMPEAINFDLSKPEKQEVTYVNEAGEEVTFGIEPIMIDEELSTLIDFPCITNCSSPIDMGRSTWKIYSYSGAINMSYRIDINRTSSGASITDAYDLSVNLIGYSEDNRRFVYSSKKAEYSGTAVLAKYLPVSLSIMLIAEVNGSTLTTKAKS